MSTEKESMFTSFKAFKETAFTKTFITGLILSAYGVYMFVTKGSADANAQYMAITNFLLRLSLMGGRDAIRSSTAQKLLALQDIKKQIQDGTVTQETIEKSVGTIIDDK